MTQEKDYFAFISYKREDEKWAKWLANELEHYHLPSTLNGKDLPKSLRPIFRDVDELSAGNLPKQIYHALSISKNLIVICSPRSAQSEWVNKEIEDFIKIKGGKADNIYPFIIEGVPFSKDADKECFPEKLRSLQESEERLGGNINEQGGRNAAVVKIIAGMLGIGFDSLWQKNEREKKRKRNWMIAATIVAFLCISGIAFWMYWQYQQTQKANWMMMENQAKAVAEKAREEIKKGNTYEAILALLEVVPDKGKRPFVAEVEAILRMAVDSLESGNWSYRRVAPIVESVHWSDDEKCVIVGNNEIFTAIDAFTLQNVSDSTFVKNWREKNEKDNELEKQLNEKWEHSNVFKRNVEIMNYNHNKGVVLFKDIEFLGDNEYYTLFVWDYLNDVMLLSVDNDGQFFDDIDRPHHGGVTVTSFSNDGSLLAISYTNGGGLLIDLDKKTQTPLFCGDDYCDHYSNTYLFGHNNLLVHFSRFTTAIKIIDPHNSVIVDSISTADLDEVHNALLNADGNKCFVRFVEDGLYMYCKNEKNIHADISTVNLTSLNNISNNDTIINGRYSIECNDDGIHFKDLNGELNDWTFSNGWECGICGLIMDGKYIIIGAKMRFECCYSLIDLLSGVEMHRWYMNDDLYFSTNNNCFVIKSYNDMITTYDFPVFDDLIQRCKEMTKGMELTLLEKKKYYL